MKMFDDYFVISETEEEFFQHCVGDGRVGDKPDLGHIQQMLDMVSAVKYTESQLLNIKYNVITTSKEKHLQKERMQFILILI